MLRCINRLVTVDEGDIVVDGNRVTDPKPDLDILLTDKGMQSIPLVSALGGGRTRTPCGTWPSTMPVCQFQHQRRSLRRDCGIIADGLGMST